MDEEFLNKLYAQREEIFDLKLLLDEVEVYQIKNAWNLNKHDTRVYLFKPSVNSNGELEYESVLDGLKVTNLDNFEYIEDKLAGEIDLLLTSFEENIESFTYFIESENFTFAGIKMDYDLISQMIMVFGTVLITLVESLFKEGSD